MISATTVAFGILAVFCFNSAHLNTSDWHVITAASVTDPDSVSGSSSLVYKTTVVEGMRGKSITCETVGHPYQPQVSSSQPLKVICKSHHPILFFSHHFVHSSYGLFGYTFFEKWIATLVLVVWLHIKAFSPFESLITSSFYSWSLPNLNCGSVRTTCRGREFCDLRAGSWLEPYYPNV